MRWPIGLTALFFVGTAAADPRVEQARKEGEVVWYTAMNVPDVTSPSQVGISAKAPHPAAARLFVDFLLSREGQAVIQSRGRVPARTDLPTGTGAGPLKLHYVDPRLAPQFNQYEKEFREIFGRAP